MTTIETAELRLALKKVIADAIDHVGIAAFKRTSLFGSNDPAFKASKTDLAKAA